MPYEGQAHMDPSMSFRYLGNQYLTLIEALTEYIMNGGDGIWELYDTGEVYVVYHPDKIQVIDTGCGMLARMLPADLKKRMEYYAALDRGEKPSGNLQDMISDLSKHTLEYFVTNFGLSRKANRIGGRVFSGTRGVGSLAFLQFANRMTLYTRPAGELVDSYWDEAHKQHADFASKRPKGHIPTTRLDMFTREQIEHGLRPFNIEDEEPVSMLTDPFGNTLEHGTCVEITELNKGVLTGGLSMERVRQYLGSRLANQLRNGQLNIAIVDCMTKEARNSNEGFIVLPVEPTRYTGVLLYKDTLSVRDPRGHKSYDGDVEIYWDTNAKGSGIELHRLTFSSDQPLRAIPELNRAPWNRSDLQGYIQFPQAPESVAPWNTAKTLPTDSPLCTEWIKAVQKIGRDIEEKIRESQERVGSERSHQINQMLADILSGALSDLGIVDVTKTVIRKVKTSRPSVPPTVPPEIMTDVQVRVVNEHGKGKEDVEVILDNTRYERTGVHGRIVFGRQPQGRHSISIVVPDGVTLKGPDTRVFSLTRQDPGAEITFRLETGEPASPRSGNDTTIEIDELPGLVITQAALSDPDKPFDGSKLDGGTLIINSETAAFKASYGDDQAEMRLKLEISALALVDYVARKRREAPDLQLMWDLINHGILQASTYNRSTGRR